MAWLTLPKNPVLPTLPRMSALLFCRWSVFVADSQAARMEANLESLRNLDLNLKEQGYDLRAVPYVLQLNKRDLPSALPIEEMKRQLVRKGEPVFEAVASKGTGVFETLKTIAKMVLLELRKGP